jgi:hypothetical protein
MTRYPLELQRRKNKAASPPLVQARAFAPAPVQSQAARRAPKPILLETAMP